MQNAKLAEPCVYILTEQLCKSILHDEAVIDYLVDRIFELQGEENPRLPRLRLQLEDVENRIKNIITAIEQGNIFDSTKDRLTKLEKEKSQLDLTIIQEQIKKPFLTKEQIRFGIEKFKKLDISTKEGKQRLIDGFINAIYLYDDKITFTFNYKDGTKTVFLSELNCTPFGSDLKCLGAPKSNKPNLVFGLLLFGMKFMTMCLSNRPAI